MSPSNGSDRLPNTYLRQFFRFLGSREILLAGTSETPASLANLGGSNSFRDYCQFFRNAREYTTSPDIGLVLGRVNQLANLHGPLSAAVYHSSDMRNCLELLQRFIPLRLPVVRASRVDDTDNIGMQIEFQTGAGDIHPAVTETMLLSISNIFTVISQNHVYPSRIELDYPRPAYANHYRDAFGVPAIHFDCPQIRVFVARSDADYSPDTDPDPLLCSTVIERCEQLLRGAAESLSTSDRIKQVFADNPGHLWSIAAVAKHLNLSARTLQRRLSAEGTSYQQLHNQWLMGEAGELLREKNLSIESIALLLGYSDASNFRQACRRWYNCSPNDYRQRLCGDGERGPKGPSREVIDTIQAEMA